MNWSSRLRTVLRTEAGSSRAFALFAATAVAGTFAAVDASAHTVKLCWRDSGGVTTFYAGTYHHPSEGPSPVGKIIVDGFGYPFSGYVMANQLPADAKCVACPGSTPAVVHYQTFTSAFQLKPHTVTFDSTTVVQSPWCSFPQMTFGGGACADADFDGICNDQDACPLDAANDGDKDGRCANVDNCPNNYNPDQKDANGNGQGDVCEGVICGNGLLQGSEQCDDGNKAGGDGCSAICTIESKDADNDGVLDTSDNCPTVANPSQANNDGDSQGDACDSDDDNDGVVDASDNCPVLSNASQANADGDQAGDDCDSDDDNDGVADTVDNCKFAPNSDQANFDNDGQGDACDGDDDNDGVADGADNCSTVANTDQANLDGDAFGDACDTDDDGDGVDDTADNCAGDSNPDQADLDNDNLGDVCDADDDNDGVADNGTANCSATVCNGLNFQGGCQTLGAGVHDYPAINSIVGNDQAKSLIVSGAAYVELWEHYTPYQGQTFTGQHVTYTSSAADLYAIGGAAYFGVSSVFVACPATDNCPTVSNADQANNDGDAQGDACDTDDDNDGVADTADNCQLVGNADQANNDGDAQGDACDDDDDNDTVSDDSDNCQMTGNADQVNTDGDSLGDACDPDLDGDTVANEIDNCPATINAGQEDLDGDGQGDLCDGDIDGDSVANGLDNCPVNSNASQSDIDGDTAGDACDPDMDGDNVANTVDNCATIVNADQQNTDGDSQGDACDADDDNDSVADTADNCPVVANAGQANFDGDDLGDACDSDDDGDAVADTADVCPWTPASIVVDPATGCSVAQLCPCAGPRGSSSAWKNHGQYVSCVAKSTTSFVSLGLMTETEKGVTVSTAGGSTCGAKK